MAAKLTKMKREKGAGTANELFIKFTITSKLNHVLDALPPPKVKPIVIIHANLSACFFLFDRIACIS